MTVVHEASLPPPTPLGLSGLEILMLLKLDTQTCYMGNAVTGRVLVFGTRQFYDCNVRPDRSCVHAASAATSSPFGAGSGGVWSGRGRPLQELAKAWWWRGTLCCLACIFSTLLLVCVFSTPRVEDTFCCLACIALLVGFRDVSSLFTYKYASNVQACDTYSILNLIGVGAPHCQYASDDDMQQSRRPILSP